MELSTRLVSIITPAYNTSKYIFRLLDSVLSQTYPFIEMIVVDDGSTDNLSDIIGQYKQRFAERGYRFEYVFQSNSGQSVAIQNALGYVKGEYLTWPDSDDYFAGPDVIERFVQTFEEAGEECGMVRCLENIINEDTGNIIRIAGRGSHSNEPDTLFDDCLLDCNGFYFVPGAYMVRTVSLLKSTELPIFTSHDAGQNWQLYLPVLFSYRCRTILEPLYNVLHRKNSHSRAQLDYYKFRQRQRLFETTILETLKKIKSMNETERQLYTQKVRQKYALLLWNTAVQYANYEDELTEYTALKELSFLTRRQRFRHLIFRMRLLSAIRVFKRLINIKCI